MNNSDIVFLAHRLNTFVGLMQDPNALLKYERGDGLPESNDLRIISAGLYLLFDCYMRGMGLKYHPKSKTLDATMEKLNELYEAVRNEAEARPYLYRHLQGALGRSQATVELDFLIDGYSKWSEEYGEKDEE